MLIKVEVFQNEEEENELYVVGKLQDTATKQELGVIRKSKYDFGIMYEVVTDNTSNIKKLVSEMKELIIKEWIEDRDKEIETLNEEIKDTIDFYNDMIKQTKNAKEKWSLENGI